MPPDDVPSGGTGDDEPGRVPGGPADGARPAPGTRRSSARRGGTPDEPPDDLTFVMPSTRGGLVVRMLVLASFLLGWLFTLTQP